MITRKQAEQAKEHLQTQLGKPEWLTGITLGLGGDGISIRVAVTEITDDIRNVVPTLFEGVEVILEQAIVSTPFEARWLK